MPWNLGRRIWKRFPYRTPEAIPPGFWTSGLEHRLRSFLNPRCQILVGYAVVDLREEFNRSNSTLDREQSPELSLRPLGYR